MKSRHTAALALMGWYLMMPPVRDRKVTLYDAPLSQWRIHGSYDTARECNEVLGEYQQESHYNPNNSGVKRYFGAWQCIASDDPRLKEK